MRADMQVPYLFLGGLFGSNWSRFFLLWHPLHILTALLYYNRSLLEFLLELIHLPLEALNLRGGGDVRTLCV